MSKEGIDFIKRVIIASVGFENIVRIETSPRYKDAIEKYKTNYTADARAIRFLFLFLGCAVIPRQTLGRSVRILVRF